MGNCGGLCTNNVSKNKGDIIMSKLRTDNEPSKIILPYDIEKVKFLQKYIKNFLKKKKKRKTMPSTGKRASKAKVGKMNSVSEKDKPKEIKNNNIINYNDNQKKRNSKIKPNLENKNESINISININNKINNITINNNNNFNNLSNIKENQIQAKSMNLNNNNNMNNSSSKIQNLFNDNNDKTQEIELYKKYTDEPSEDNGLLIPTIKPDLLENQIFKNDAFRSGIRKSQYENDPRDAPNDNIRKKYPKIVEEQSSYLGEWKNGKRDGLGLLCWGSESKFMGYFIEDKVIGYGKLWHEDGDSYKGQWNNFQAEGWGIYHTKKGAYFRGEWEKDKQNGFGVEKWPRGSIFFGGYIDGNKNGIGVLNFESKAWYEGEFKNGIISGVGTFVFEDGRRYEGMWKNNKMDGYGVIIWPDENEFEGEFKEDKKEGFGICKMGKKIFMGIWKNNKLEGNVIIIEDGKYKKQYWEKGKALKSLSNDTYIFFEKYVDKYLKKSRKSKSKKN